MRIYKNAETGQWAVVPGAVFDSSGLKSLLTTLPKVEATEKFTALRGYLPEAQSFIYLFKDSSASNPNEESEETIQALNASASLETVAPSDETLPTAAPPVRVVEGSMPQNGAQPLLIKVLPLEHLYRPQVRHGSGPWVYLAWSSSHRWFVAFTTERDRDALKQPCYGPDLTRLGSLLGKQGTVRGSLRWTQRHGRMYGLQLGVEVGSFVETLRPARPVAQRAATDPLEARRPESPSFVSARSEIVGATRAARVSRTVREAMRHQLQRIRNFASTSRKAVQCQLGEHTLNSLKLGLILPSTQSCPHCDRAMFLDHVNLSLTKLH